MLNKKQVQEIREHLEKAQNPVFLFDNDPDGLCSFLLLQRYIGRGRGVAIRSYPGLTKDYSKKILELKADYLFILDKPVVSQDFFNEVEKFNIPIVWIDHHPINIEDVPEFVDYYNPLFYEDSINSASEPNTIEAVTYYCYQISQKKEDLWLAVVGCISDRFIPNFYSDFIKDYPDLSLDSKDAFDVFYNSEIGKIAKIFSFALKDKTANVVTMMKFLMKAKTPYEILEENTKNHTMHQRFKEIDRKYKKLLKKALEFGKKDEKILFFKYSGNLSISSDLSNELAYTFPKKIILIAYIKGAKANISARGKGVKDIILKTLDNFEEASGGGHEVAVGGKIRTEDLEKFKKILFESV